ncbi:putative Long chain acyl-CoA synthetase 7; peroxisomal [Paratrimastix pyriformis]|uniref:Long chain acyl-CoA synthetase 7 n=1 Tax=Paratrimastix pyriformis TaxID=342808 RepID=A0ABQ8UIR6_9EUKA|nr:putative Long chain acyl-CoA synthetase 7; peroxisomal [Paratrimastix pyriformis]
MSVVVNPEFGEIHRHAKGVIPSWDSQICSLSQLFRDAAKKFAHRACLGYRLRIESNPPKWGDYAWATYSEINYRVTSFASGLRSLGFHPGNMIAVMSPNRSEYVVTNIALSTQRMVLVPIYTTCPSDRLAFCLQLAECPAVVVSIDMLAKLRAVRSQLPQLRLIIVMDDQDFDRRWIKANPLQEGEVSFSQVEAAGSAARLDDLVADPNEMAMLIFTSGTTGWPKGAMISNANLICQIQALREQVFEVPGLVDTHLSYLPLAHVFEHQCLDLFLHRGAQIGFYHGDMAGLFSDVGVLKPTFFNGAPRVYQKISQGIMGGIQAGGIIAQRLFAAALAAKKARIAKGPPPHRLSFLPPPQRRGLTTPLWDRLVFNKVKAKTGGRLRLMISGSAPCPRHIAEFMMATLVPGTGNLLEGAFWGEGYGLTETTSAVCMSSFGALPGSVGSPSTAAEVVLVSCPELGYRVTDKPRPRGEIWIRGPCVFQGYYKDPQQTPRQLMRLSRHARTFPGGRAEMMQDGWLRSGDIGEWDAKGNLFIIDRKKHLFKLSQGEYVCPDRTERVYAACPLVGQLMVWVAPGEQPAGRGGAPLGRALQAAAPALASRAHTPCDLPCPVLSPDQPKTELARDPQVRALLLQELCAAGRDKLPRYELLQDVLICPEEWTIEEGLLGNTMKPNRAAITERFRARLDELYARAPGSPGTPIPQPATPPL